MFPPIHFIFHFGHPKRVSGNQEKLAADANVNLPPKILLSADEEGTAGVLMLLCWICRRNVT